MALTLETIDQSRYITDTKARIVQFLNYYLNEDPSADGLVYAARWAKLTGGRVRVETTRTQRRPEPQGLTAPTVFLRKDSEGVDYVAMDAGQYHRYGEWHTVGFKLDVTTDGDTGRGIAADDISSALHKIFAEHKKDLSDVGVVVNSLAGGSEDDLPTEAFFSNSHDLEVEVVIYGALKSSIVVELAGCTVTARDVVNVTIGDALEVAHELRIECLNGIGPPSTDVTIHATNQDGEARDLTGTIPGSRPARTQITLDEEVSDDQYLTVTGVEIAGGTAGDHWRITNIPVQYET